MLSAGAGVAGAVAVGSAGSGGGGGGVPDGIVTSCVYLTASLARPANQMPSTSSAANAIVRMFAARPLMSTWLTATVDGCGRSGAAWPNASLTCAGVMYVPSDQLAS